MQYGNENTINNGVFMKFSEAMIQLQAGYKVTRQSWIGSMYFVLEDKSVKSYQPKLSAYTYDEDIMISDGWIVEGKEEEFKFYDIIPYLQAGLKAKMKEWKDSHIYYDNAKKFLVIHTMDVFPYVVDFTSFVAQDWVVLS